MPSTPVRVGGHADSTPIPVYRIDLSLPPSERYVQLTKDFAPKMRPLVRLWDEILALLIPYAFVRSIVKVFARLFLKRVHDGEQTEEVKGIAKTADLPLHLVVALNVMLDSLLGCTSGGVLTRSKTEGEEDRMMHFRTLDWGMEGLRDLLVVLEFVRSDSANPDQILARTVTYAGFTGVLTGVRKDLSMSLNFRPTHSCSTLALRTHQLLVLLGFRPSICSVLRSTLFDPPAALPLSLPDLASSLSWVKSSPCYLVLCTPHLTTTIEKDLSTGLTSSSPSFIVYTNHDLLTKNAVATPTESRVEAGLGYSEDFLKESEDRMRCIMGKWKYFQKKAAKGGEVISVDEEMVQKWTWEFPILNVETHYGCILDPQTGEIRWLERGTIVAEAKDKSEQGSKPGTAKGKS